MNEDESTVTLGRGVRDPDRGDDVATLPARPGGMPARRRPAARTTPPSSEMTLAMLRDEEIRTARVMIRIGRWIGIAALLPLPLVGGDDLVARAFAIGCAIAILVGLVIERRIRDPARYGEAAMIALAVSVMPAAFTGIAYWGTFSAVQLFPVLAIYFFSRRTRFATTLAIYLGIAISQAALAAAVIGHVVRDPGLFEPHLPATTLIIGHVLIQIGDLAAFVLGSSSRRATLAALATRQQAMLLAAKREALLDEARQELARARKVGGAGRYTDHVFGGYRLGAVLGRGGMGEVYEARHVDRDAPAAVKLLPTRELANPRALERFVREVRAVSQLRSPHVVRVLAASEAHDPIPFLVMERLEGATLSHLLREGRLPAAELVEMLEQVGTALEEAWAQGIVHRDLKPHNLVRSEAAGWKVLDFGVASLADHGGTLTEGHVVGTPAYMAPEQARGERVDGRADLYALAAIAYRWLTGRPVCSGDDLQAALYQIVHGAPPRPSAMAPLPPDVDAVLAIGLAHDPADRFATAAELAAALAAGLLGLLEPALRQRAAALEARRPWRA